MPSVPQLNPLTAQSGQNPESAKHQGNVLDFVYWLGLLLLMFLACAETQQLLRAMNGAKSAEERC
jgi:hypothetical protein